MFQIIPSNDRYSADFGWLKTRWHFSFGDYYDPKNVNFGALRVFNDDIIEGGGGFDTHGHRDMEIISWLTKGAMTHTDSTGNDHTLHPNEVQVMSAGKGILHGEHNASKTEAVRLMQIWIEPRHKGNTPRWDQTAFDPKARVNKLFPIVTSDGRDGTMQIDQDATMYVSTLKKGESVRHTSDGKRRAYLFVVDGAVEVNGKALANGDQARITAEPSLNITASEDAEVMLIDLP